MCTSMHRSGPRKIQGSVSVNSDSCDVTYVRTAGNRHKGVNTLFNESSVPAARKRVFSVNVRNQGPIHRLVPSRLRISDRKPPLVSRVWMRGLAEPFNRRRIHEHHMAAAAVLGVNPIASSR